MEIGGVRLRSQKAKVDGLREQIDTLNEQYMQADIAKTKAEKNRTKSEKSYREGLEEMESVTADKEKLEDQIKVHTKSTEDIKARVEEAQNFLEEKKEELGGVKEELETKKKEINEARAVEVRRPFLLAGWVDWKAWTELIFLALVGFLDRDEEQTGATSKGSIREPETTEALGREIQQAHSSSTE